jgi:hypothetical protein
VGCWGTLDPATSSIETHEALQIAWGKAASAKTKYEEANRHRYKEKFPGGLAEKTTSKKADGY